MSHETPNQMPPSRAIKGHQGGFPGRRWGDQLVGPMIRSMRSTRFVTPDEFLSHAADNEVMGILGVMTGPLTLTLIIDGPSIPTST